MTNQPYQLKERLVEAAKLAALHTTSRFIIDLGIQPLGVAVRIGKNGAFTQKIVSWDMIEFAYHNPLITEINKDD